MSEEKYQRGLKQLQELDPKALDSLNVLEKVVPGLARIIVEYEFADVYTRPGLDLKTRQLVTIAALTALGHAIPQLRVHTEYALNTGSTRQEIYEVIIHTAPFVGFPAIINALKMAKEVCDAREKNS